MQQALTELAPSIGVAQACRVLGVPRAQYYRALQPPPAKPTQAPAPAATARSPRALSPAERDAIHALLNSERFVDLSPREIYATLLDEGVYVCSWPTMYRILREHGQTTRRRDLVQGGAYAKPELLATAPRELSSWDITKLKGPATWTVLLSVCDHRRV